MDPDFPFQPHTASCAHMDPIEKKHAVARRWRPSNLPSERAHDRFHRSYHDKHQVGFRNVCPSRSHFMSSSGPRRRSAAFLNQSGYKLPSLVLHGDPTPGSKNGGVLNRLRRTVPDPSRCMCMCSCLSSTSSPAPGSDLESHHRDAIRAIRMWHDTPSSSSSYRARFVAGGAYRNERSRARVIYLDPLSHSTGRLIGA